MTQLIPSPVTSLSTNTTLFPISQLSVADFEMFYDKYAPAFYGEIKSKLRNEEVSKNVMKEACLKIYQTLGQQQQAKEKAFLAAFRVVRKEISKTKVSIALNQILYAQLQKHQAATI